MMEASQEPTQAEQAEVETLSSDLASFNQGAGNPQTGDEKRAIIVQPNGHTTDRFDE